MVNAYSPLFFFFFSYISTTYTRFFQHEGKCVTSELKDDDDLMNK